MKKQSHRAGSPLLALLFPVLGILALLWLAVNVHPDSGTIHTDDVAQSKSTMNLMTRFDQFVNNTASDSLSSITYIKKSYTIPETDLVAPAPSYLGYGETTDPAEVQAVVDAAADLLGGQTTEWNPDLELMPGSTIKYYYDETLLVICWKEVINRGVYSFAEVKVADGSQLRRAIAENTYGSSVQLYPSDMAKTANAVVAINGDFYAYRSQGITVYQRTMYRFVPAKVDSCFFSSDGKMHFIYRGSMTQESEAQAYIEENDIVFSLAFGPVLVDNGELKHTDSYPIGEIDKDYSRAGIGELGELHYLLAVLGEQNGYARRCNINEFGETLYNKHCINAYTLDGGQTATLVFNNSVFNRVDWDSERTMSDIVYFATALSSEEVNG